MGDALVRRLTSAFLVAAALYHLYLVLHPFNPLLNHFRIPVLDLTQLSRATHVWLVVTAGYLIAFMRPAQSGGRRAGGLLMAALSASPLILLLGAMEYRPAESGLAVLSWVVSMAAVLKDRRVRWLDLVAAALAALPYLYMVFDYEALIYRAVVPTTWDLAMGWSLAVLVLGLVFRFIGPVMPVLVLVFMLYNVFGAYVPGALGHAGFGVDFLLGKIYVETEAALFGQITGISAKYLVYFTILGGVLSSLGIGKILANMALVAVGRSPAGPGRTTALLSLLMGMFSGSGAADTQFVATLTRPLYDQAGYDREAAGGIVATAGTVALITPPVLGSAAFLMVELLGIRYLTVVIMSIIPALLYILAILLYNEQYVKKAGLRPVSVENVYGWAYVARRLYVFLPIVLIVYMIVRGFSVDLAVTFAVFLSIAIAYLSPETRPALRAAAGALGKGFEGLIPTAGAVVAANIIMAMMVLTGLPSKFSLLLTQVSGHSLLLATLFAAGFSLLLGMGVPPVATYTLASALTAPAIIGMAVSNGIPEKAAVLATHMFLFYYAVLADITPPVALSAYAAASVMETDPIRTGVRAALVALPKYVIGFLFILSYSGTALLIVPVLETAPAASAVYMIATRLVATAVAIWFMAVGNVGYSTRPMSAAARMAAGLAGLLLMHPNLGVNAAGLAVGLVTLLAARGPSMEAVQRRAV
ncbi:TRAP transporter fused permease subunit [Carboxydochorda subterranea]|uniref:TRAP transporter fused permease subunit n=1 Tax=Carboxydichorda subterranea TaxID=3109565 RepID=A0ABZ1C176_9FIRM|nr:TRAP transporter fused permease subunit [Limnochorda sp. L945t]WRP18758.1 TRAP transporter fused permease subunit [Limnochorda sp. L945t]